MEDVRENSCSAFVGLLCNSTDKDDGVVNPKGSQLWVVNSRRAYLLIENAARIEQWVAHHS